MERDTVSHIVITLAPKHTHQPFTGGEPGISCHMMYGMHETMLLFY